MDQLSLIIISYNSHAIIEKCLGSLIDSAEFPVSIVDNYSTNGSAELLQYRFPTAEVVALKQNIGYGRAANIGLRKAQTPYVMLLNPDLHASVESINQLLSYALSTDLNTAIFAPAVKKKDCSNQPPESVSWISGSAMLFDMNKIKAVGLFDENIFLFSEESDLCRRTTNAGYKIMLCHDIYLDHLKGQSSAPNLKIEYMKSWHFGWSRAYYSHKHNLLTGQYRPKRTFWRYYFKSLIATNQVKRGKYKARATGTRAFIKGEKAFLPDGTPKAFPTTKD